MMKCKLPALLSGGHHIMAGDDSKLEREDAAANQNKQVAPLGPGR